MTMHHHLNKNRQSKENNRQSPHTKDIVEEKRKHKRKDGLGLSFYSVSGSEDTEASYPDSGSVRDSTEGGPEELEEVVDKVGEGV